MNYMELLAVLVLIWIWGEVSAIRAVIAPKQRRSEEEADV